MVIFTLKAFERHSLQSLLYFILFLTYSGGKDLYQVQEIFSIIIKDTLLLL